MKKILMLFGIVLICSAGYLIYLFGFKDYNVADAEVDSLTKEEYVIELADGSRIILDAHGNLIRHLQGNDEAVQTEKFREGMPYSETTDPEVASVSSENGQQTKEQQKSSKEKAEAKKAKNDKKSKGAKLTEKEVRQNYEPAIADIERQANASLNNLISIAKNEYFEMEANDQKISYPYFYNKYSSAASKLEKRTDEVFYGLMAMMKKDLKANGLPDSLPKSLSKEYENRKDKLRRDILKETAGL